MSLLAGRRFWPTAVATGLAFGAISVFPYEGAGGVLRVVGHSAALWLLVAFGFGAAAGGMRRGAVAGLVSLLAVVTGFYLLYGLLNSGENVVRLAVFWLAAAVVGGPVYGAIGALWRGGTDRARGVASAAMGAAFVAEAVLFHAPSLVRLGEGILGLALTAALAHRRAPLYAALVAFPAFLLVGVIGWVFTKYAAHLYFVPDRFGSPPHFAPPRP